MHNFLLLSPLQQQYQNPNTANLAYIFKVLSEQSPIVVLYTFNQLQTAQLAEGMLLAAGIPCFLVDTHMSSLIANSGLGLGGLRLMVFEKDKDEAWKLLEPCIQ